MLNDIYMQWLCPYMSSKGLVLKVHILMHAEDSLLKKRRKGLNERFKSNNFIDISFNNESTWKDYILWISEK